MSAAPVPPTEPVEHVDAAPPDSADGEALVEEELLVEEISIDGLCGVY